MLQLIRYAGFYFKQALFLCIFQHRTRLLNIDESRKLVLSSRANSARHVNHVEESDINIGTHICYKGELSSFQQRQISKNVV